MFEWCQNRYDINLKDKVLLKLRDLVMAYIKKLKEIEISSQ